MPQDISNKHGEANSCVLALASGREGHTTRVEAHVAHGHLVRRDLRVGRCSTNASSRAKSLYDTVIHSRATTPPRVTLRYSDGRLDKPARTAADFYTRCNDESCESLETTGRPWCREGALRNNDSRHDGPAWTQSRRDIQIETPSLLRGSGAIYRKYDRQWCG